MRVIGVVTILVLASFGGILSQERALEPGQRVRVTVPSLDFDKHRATFQRLHGDTLVLSSGSYSLADVTRLDVYAGRRGHLWTGAVVGASAGALAGFCLGSVANDQLDSSDQASYYAWAFAGVGAAGGMLIGGVVGALIRSDKWERVPLDRLRVSIAPTRNGFGIGGRIAF